jgi:hypothetical protein
MAQGGADAAPRFALGRVLLTQGARASLTDDEIDLALAMHGAGSWGDMERGDKARNDLALIKGDRLVSVYSLGSKVRFYVITEWDRSVTTVLLPSEY